MVAFDFAVGFVVVFFAFTILKERLTVPQTGFVVLALAGLVWAALPDTKTKEGALTAHKPLEG